MQLPLEVGLQQLLGAPGRCKNTKAVRVDHWVSVHPDFLLEQGGKHTGASVIQQQVWDGHHLVRLTTGSYCDSQGRTGRPLYQDPVAVHSMHGDKPLT